MSPSTSRGAVILDSRRRIALIQVEETSRDTALEPQREDSLTSSSSRSEGDGTSMSSLQEELVPVDLQRRVNSPCSSCCATPCPFPACIRTASGTENTGRTADSEERLADEQQEASVNIVSQCCCSPVCAAVAGMKGEKLLPLQMLLLLSEDVAVNVSLRGAKVNAEPVLPQPAVMQNTSRQRLQL
ncbi:hypothetical protein MHYP_G00270860 [Metynnis hypsauchen]